MNDSCLIRLYSHFGVYRLLDCKACNKDCPVYKMKTSKPEYDMIELVHPLNDVKIAGS